MHINTLKAMIKKLVPGAAVLLLGMGMASAQQQIALTAGASTVSLPDGNSVPMWGYTCGAAVSGSTATCAKLNPTATGWSPVVITVPATAAGGLQINLTNNLVFAGASVPTSLTIVGQIGGGLGTGATTVASPDHSGAQSAATWPIAGAPGPGAPAQGPRVQSFGTEVAAGAGITSANTTSLTWATLRPGTYLMESGTHPSIQGPMGLYGILVVTTAATASTTGTAYTGVSYNAEVPMLFSEIDPVQNTAVQTAVGTAGFNETTVWSGQPGGCGNPASPTYHQCYPPAVNYTPLYYMINGVAFNKSSAANSVFAASPATTGNTAAGTTATVLVRLVNAGLRMHIPSIVGSKTGTAGTVGFSLIAEDGNALPGTPRVQSEIFMAAGKTYDVMINVPTSSSALPIYDRQLSLSGNATGRDEGMVAYIGVNGSAAPVGASGTSVARPDTYGIFVPGNTTVVSDPEKGVIANDTNVYQVQVLSAPGSGTLVLNPDGTFSFAAPSGFSSTSFTYCAVVGGVCSTATATVTLTAAAADTSTNITCTSLTFTSNSSNYISVPPPGLLAACKDSAGYPLTVDVASIAATGASVTAAANGGFIATTGAPSTNTAGGVSTFSFKAKSSYGVEGSPVNVTINFRAGSGIAVTVVDGNDKTTKITDYRWVIEEDRTFYIDPNCTTNPPPAACVTGTNSTGGKLVPTFGVNFHTSYMPVVATGCTGPLSCESGQSLAGVPAVCDVGNGICRSGSQELMVSPGQVSLDPKKRYYISVLPGDAANPFNTGNVVAGHGMGGAPISFACPPTVISAGAVVAGTCPATPTWAPVTILTQPTPLQTAKLSVFVFEDDFPLNGENDAGGQVADTQLGTQEPGLGGFEITLFDDAGGTGDATGQMTYDMFNMPLSNSLAGTPDPANGGKDACPISQQVTADATQKGITGMILTCPKYEADGTTPSPLAGQAVVANLMPGRYGVVATPAADRIARGEEWLQTNTLDGQKAHDSFLRVGEPSFFQEYGPASYHVSIGFANPAIINKRLLGNKDPNTGTYSGGVCSGGDLTYGVVGTNCTNSVKGRVTTERMSRTPDERLYSSGDNTSFGFTQCYVSFGDPDGEDFAFTKCDGNGNFTLTGLPDGDWRITVFDQWNDMLVDGLSTPVRLAKGAVVNMGDIATNQWQSNIYTSTFFDTNGNGVRDPGEEGLALVATNNRFRDGSYSNFNNTDLDGNAGFNEIFPLFSWYVIETDSTRYKNTGTHVVYDAGGPADGTAGGGPSGIAANLANTLEAVPVPSALRVPGAFYCATADCIDAPAPLLVTSAAGSSGTGGSTGRVDPAWVLSEGWQGFSGQNNIIEFGKKPYAVGENGGIHGEVIYASTRPFDDPALLIHTSWTPDVPNVTINLYQEGSAPDGSTSLTLVDTTKTSSFDDWAQGFRTDGVPNMNCPGQGRDTGTNADLFFFSLFDQPNYLDLYNNGGTPAHSMPNDSQFKCYDGMHNWNQVQPAPYDGQYTFPSVTGRNPATGNTTGTNCTICVKNTDSTDPFRFNKEDMLPAGKYVVEVVVPPGYELVKEEDKNILIGDNYIAPVTQQFGGLANIFILPDQAATGSQYNPNSPQMPTNNQGRTTLPSTEADTGSVEQLWPCVGQMRVVPDYISLFPQSNEVAPFAGAMRPLCDRKEVTLHDQTAALAKFWVFTSAHTAAHFTGVITDDFTSEFDPFAPTFGEKFSPPDMPVSIKDWAGNEISRVYADHWGSYNGLTYSTWEVNPPNPTGYAPTMMITCMNDPGTGATPDPLYNPQYSNFCYEIPFMPGQTQYMDTPVTPTSAFAGAGYNNPDCAYPDKTPAIAEVDGDGIGPWVAASGGSHTLKIAALGDQSVPNNAYSGPSSTTAPYNQKTITRHYGFGSTAGTVALVGSDGTRYPLTGVSWSDGSITGVVPTVPSANSICPITQQTEYGGSAMQCAELLIISSDNKQSVDTVTVTIGGKTPTHVNASASVQSAIDAAKPGDLLIIDPTCTPTNTTTGATSAALSCSATAPAGTTLVHSNAVHSELLLMWKPVRLQGVGAASSIIDGNTHPAGKLNTWRAKVNCLFGLGLAGTPNTWASSCGTGWYGFKASATNPQVDRLPLEAVVGWDATLNGNLAQLLQEPTLMGALEGAAITVLSKGVEFPRGSDPFASDTFPTGTVLLNNSTSTARGCGPTNGSTTNPPNPFPSNFMCNPSSIDGLGVRNSSQGGGGIFVHAWGHYLQIANNRVANNAGTLSGGINVGQGEFPVPYLAGAANTAINAAPGSCQTEDIPANAIEPYCHDIHVNVHNNAIMLNSSTGDELFSATPAGAGGISFCTGADYYKFQYNWVCGNLSTGDGGGFGHVGLSYNGDIEHNAFLFNQSTNPTIQANGGGLIIMGAPDADPTCNAIADIDCTVAPNAIGPSDGIGPGLVINANLIMGNSADSGTGGGISFQNVNGSDVVSFPTTPTNWHHVVVTNNIIVNNVAGWDGAGISLLDALNADIINNTIASNDTTASAGPLFNTLGAPLASQSGPTCTANCGTTSAPQPAGLVSVQNSAVLGANFPATITCPTGHFAGTGTTAARNGSCRKTSYPKLENNVIWKNRPFYIGVGALGGGTLNQQYIVNLFEAFTTTMAPSQSNTGAVTANGNGSIITGGTGACVAFPTTSYWDIGVRGDTGPTNHGSGVTLNPTFSVMTSVAGYPTNNSAADPRLLLQYCNGSRIPPENTTAGSGWQVPPGISDATVPNPVFNLTPAATVDEGNNWINMSWGPLTMVNPVTNAALSNYGPASGSPVIGMIASTVSPNYADAPSFDFYGNGRKGDNHVDAGAIEFNGTGGGGGQNTPTLTSITPNTGAQGTGGLLTPVQVTLVGTNLTGASAITATGTGVTFSNITVVSATTVTANVTITTTAAATARTVTVTTPGGVSNGVTFTVVARSTGTLSFTSATGGTLATLLGVRTLTFPTPTAPRGGTQTAVVTVTATGGPVQITEETIGAALLTGNPQDFSITGTTCSFTTPLAAAGTCTVSITYSVPATAPGILPNGAAVTVVNEGTNPNLVLVAIGH